MSYDTLNGAAWTDPKQLPALLSLVEGPIQFLYNDGSGNATIGIGLNLNGNSDNMAVVLSQMVYNDPGSPIDGLSVIQAASQLFGVSASVVVSTFESAITSFTLKGNPDGRLSTQNPTTVQLQNTLNGILAGFFGLTVAQLPTTMVTFSHFLPPAIQTSFSEALSGVPTNTIAALGNYPTIAGWGSLTKAWLSGGNPWGIVVPTANLPLPNTGAWEALVSLFFNSATTIAKHPVIGKGLLTALKAGDLTPPLVSRIRKNAAIGTAGRHWNYGRKHVFGR